jgi:CheY-like chemotaxis protein
MGCAEGLKTMNSIINGRFVLCVDDEAVGLMMRKEVLETRGYCVFTAESGRDALEIFSSEPIDLVILDYKMPGMNGDVVAERMKRLKPSVPILMLSAYVDLPRETLALVDMYLTKGEGPLIMLKAATELLTRTQTAQAVRGS